MRSFRESAPIKTSSMPKAQKELTRTRQLSQKFRDNENNQRRRKRRRSKFRQILLIRLYNDKRGMKCQM